MRRALQPSAAQAPRRPILRYHGGKWRVAPWIIAHLPEHRTYVEPFAGAASVLLRKPRSNVEVLNDRSDRLVSAFRVLRDPASAVRLAELLRLTPYAHAEYLACREPCADAIEDARRLIVLAYQGHGSTAACGGRKTGWRRANRNARTTIAAAWAQLPDQVAAWSERLSGVFIESSDALEIITRYDGPETLCYVDPPYVTRTRRAGSGAYEYEMSDADHAELAEALHAVRGSVVLSGYDSALYRSLYPGWRCVHASAIADQGCRAVETLWLSPRASKGQGKLFAEGM